MGVICGSLSFPRTPQHVNCRGWGSNYGLNISATHSPICATILSARPDSSKDLTIPIKAVWDAQQKDLECQKPYQNIVEKGEMQENTTISFIISEDLIYWVVKLPYKKTYQVYIPESLQSNFCHPSTKTPSLVILGNTRPTDGCKVWFIGQSWAWMSNNMWETAESATSTSQKVVNQ